MVLPAKFAALGITAYLAAACAVSHAQAASTGSEPALSSPKGQAWPNKPVRLLVGFPPGGPTDVVARIVSDKVAQQIGQRIVTRKRGRAS